MLQPVDGCSQWYAEEYIGMPLVDYAASLPSGSSRINFVMTGATLPLPRNFDSLFGSDIALNVAFMLELNDADSDALVMYIDVTGVSGCASGSPSSRRLLSLVTGGPLTLAAFIFGNVTTAIPRLAEVLNSTSNSSTSGDSITQRLSELLEHRVSAGNFVTLSVQLNVTQSAASPIDRASSSSTGVYVADDLSTSSFDWTDGRIAGVSLSKLL